MKVLLFQFPHKLLIHYVMSGNIYGKWCIYFVYHVQNQQTPLLSALDGYGERSDKCNMVKYFIQKKKMDTSQFSQVMQSLCLIWYVLVYKEDALWFSTLYSTILTDI